MAVNGPNRTAPLIPYQPTQGAGTQRPSIGTTGNTTNAVAPSGTVTGTSPSLTSGRVAQNTRSHGTEPLDARAQFPRQGNTTRETLLAAVLADDGKGGMAVTYTNGTKAQRAQIERIADECIKVGVKENVDARLLFAMAMKESTLGLNTSHNSSAQGITGLKPTSAPDASARKSLANTEVCLTQTARYLKGPIVQELNSKGFNVSASDLQPGRFGDNTKMMLLSYRHGAGGFSAMMSKNHNNLDQVINGTTVKGKHVGGSDYKKLFGYIADMPQ